MIPRYQAPFAGRIFDDQYRIDLWTSILRDQAVSICPDDAVKSKIEAIKAPPWQSVVTREQTTGHDVVAFLSLILGPLDRECHQFIHFGLTSSDIVENATLHQLRSHTEHMLGLVSRLGMELQNRAPKGPPGHPRVGRTHGQIAEVTTIEHQFATFQGTARRLGLALEELSGDLLVRKSPGAVGTSMFRTPVPSYNVRSSQVVPRDFFVCWVNVYLRVVVFCETLAMWVRAGARAEVGEFREGTERVGSSAMPHKTNPITSEKVCGLARLARGYHLAVVETAGALWEDRDISNSSVERVALADMAHLVEHMVGAMTGVISFLEIDFDRMKETAAQPEAWTSVAQTALQREARVGPVEAQDIVKVAWREVDAYRKVASYEQRWAFFSIRLYKAAEEAYGRDVATNLIYDLDQRRKSILA